MFIFLKLSTKKELDARVMENSGMVHLENGTQLLFRKISSVFFCNDVFVIPDGFQVSDVKFLLTTLTSLA